MQINELSAVFGLTALQASLGLAIIYFLADWFGMKPLWPVGVTLVACYFLMAKVTGFFFFLTEFRAANLAIQVAV